MSLVKSLSIVHGVILIGFGLNWYRSMASALSFFNVVPPPADSQHAPTVECMGAVIGVRNLFMGIGIIAAALFKEKKTLGVLLLTMASVAWVDGVATNAATGEGAWTHWNYAPYVALLGVANLRSS